MDYLQQTTLKNPINCSGIGLHSGRQVAIVLRPAEPDSGIVFMRTDIAGRGARIPARWDQVSNTRLCTTLSNADGITVGTVEHLMSAFAGCGIDNALVEIDAAEVPIMDGSAAPFQFLIECAGTKPQATPRKAIRIEKEITVRDGERLARFSPSDATVIHCEIDFAAEAIARQDYRFHLRNGSFKAELSRARTFGQLHEVDHLRQIGLARGGSFANAIVVSGDQILNEEGLRFTDEFARHKALDALGDLYLAGRAFIGEFYGYLCGHELNNRILHALFADESAWSLCDMPAEESAAPVPIPAVAANEALPLAATA